MNMSSIKCHNCGLINFADLENCKRCRAVLKRGEGAPEQQTVGAWRDRWWLVKKLGVQLNNRCIKCSETNYVTYRTVTVKTYSAWSLLTQWAGVRIYTMIPVDVPLCRRHRSGPDKMVIGTSIVGGCLIAAGVALMMMTSILPIVLFMTGFFVMAGGFVIYLVRRDVVKAWRYKDPYIWLWGVHRSYLDALPEWSERQAR
jgi:hypothetical protein